MKVCIWFSSHDTHSFEDSQLLIMEKIRNLYFYKKHKVTIKPNKTNYTLKGVQ